MKIEGNWDKGSIMIADFHSTRMALRWQVPPKRKFDARKWAEAAMSAEVGQLMLKESKEHVPGEIFSAGRLFTEPEPPGRDVWVGQSRVSHRLLEVVYQTKTVSRVLRDQILPGISDQEKTAEQYWSIFDLTCTIPAGWVLRRQRLNAGDLTLSFEKKNDALIVRQLAPATLALSRQPLERWLESQQQIWKKTYRLKGAIERVEVPEDDRTILGRKIPRRRRFFLARWISPGRVTLVTHDVSRDRIVMVDASTRELALQTLLTVGKAAE